MNIFKPLNLVDNSFGGKAMGLKHLINAGVNVPAGISIPPQNLLKVIRQFPKQVMVDITSYFDSNDLIAVRSSALNEDGVEQSFAGQYKTILNVQNNEESLKSALQTVFDSSLSKEIQKYSGNQQDLMGVVVQKMIDPKYAGVMFTEATDLNGDNCCLIEVVEGLGEKLVSGHSNTTRMIIPYRNDTYLDLKNARIEGEIQDKTIIYYLVESINKINKYFKKGMDIEWCIDKNNIPYIVQARPITKHILIPKINNNNGVIASIGACKGKTFVIDSDLDDDELIPLIQSFPQGSILIAPFTDTQYMPAINRAIGIITEEGSILSHAAIISREKGIPCIVAFKNASKLFPTGTEISLNTATGTISSKTFSSDCEKRDIDWESIYIFENISEDIVLDSCRIIVENSPLDEKDFVVHIPYDISTNQYNEIEYYIRKKYHQPAKFLASEKYLWFDEFSRFSNFGIFNHYMALSKTICKERNVDKINELYQSILKDTKHLVDLKGKSTSPYDIFKIEETMASLHLIADSIIPDGYGLLSVYKDVTKFSKVSFKDFLNGSFNQNDDSLNNDFKFLKTISNFRNSICQKFVDMGAYSFDYFDDREQRARAAIGKVSKDPITDFYKQIELENVKKNDNCRIL